MNDRSNFRDCNGEVVDTGSELQTNLLLIVDETPPPPGSIPPFSPPLTLISLKPFRTNQVIIDYFSELGLADPLSLASDISHFHNEWTTGRWWGRRWGMEGITYVMTKYRVMAPEGKWVIKFRAHWPRDVPSSHFPPGPLGPEDLVAKRPLFLRFASDQDQRKFQFARNDTTYPVPVESILQLKFNLSDPELGAIFNDLTVDDVASASFAHRLQTIDEFTPP
jgi:hypothetical protein